MGIHYIIIIKLLRFNYTSSVLIQIYVLGTYTNPQSN